MVDFVKSSKTAKRLIDKNGRAVTFLRNSRTLLDENKPWGASNEVRESFETKCVFIDYNINEIDGDKIKVGDKKILVNAIDNQGKVVEDFEFVQDYGIKWRIKKVNKVQPADTVIMYEVQVRK